MLSKLFASYPATGPADMAMRAYLDDTADVPLPWLELGVSTFKNDAGRVFRPSVAEVRTGCAKAVRRARNIARGEAAGDTGGQSVNVGSAIRWAQRYAPDGPDQIRLGVGRAMRIVTSGGKGT